VHQPVATVKEEVGRDVVDVNPAKGPEQRFVFGPLVGPPKAASDEQDAGLEKKDEAKVPSDNRKLLPKRRLGWGGLGSSQWGGQLDEISSIFFLDEAKTARIIRWGLSITWVALDHGRPLRLEVQPVEEKYHN